MQLLGASAPRFDAKYCANLEGRRCCFLKSGAGNPFGLISWWPQRRIPEDWRFSLPVEVRVSTTRSACRVGANCGLVASLPVQARAASLAATSLALVVTATCEKGVTTLQAASVFSPCEGDLARVPRVHRLHGHFRKDFSKLMLHTEKQSMSVNG
jgi:hypothetical protein